MENNEIAKLAYQEILEALREVSKKYPTISFNVPSFIRVGSKLFYLEDVLQIGNSEVLLNENETSDQSL